MLMQCCGFDNRRAARYSSFFFAFFISLFVRFRTGGGNLQELRSRDVARAYDSRLSLPRVVEDTCLSNSCALTTGVTFSMYYLHVFLFMRRL